MAATTDVGKFINMITVPAGATPGTHWITALGRRTGLAPLHRPAPALLGPD
ncbi:MAG: hypothetical protein JRI57_05480 [Deltaproteobacteria bacterium]|nr:hypothetical protein [Deltaproteobacteria bacterium]MBW1986814.1 hypothetical protein [Deltaproteobacteria bacterium]